MTQTIKNLAVQTRRNIGVRIDLLRADYTVYSRLKFRKGQPSTVLGFVVRRVLLKLAEFRKRVACFATGHAFDNIPMLSHDSSSVTFTCDRCGSNHTQHPC